MPAAGPEVDAARPIDAAAPPVRLRCDGAGVQQERAGTSSAEFGPATSWTGRVKR